MRKLAVLFSFFMVLGISSVAFAQGPPMGPSMMGPGAPGQWAEMNQKRQQMMKEMHEIVLETIVLLKEVAKNPKAKAKAEKLEERMRAHIKEMQEFQEEMAKMREERMKLWHQRMGDQTNRPGQRP